MVTGRPKVLCVGHCGFDGANLARVLGQEFQADVEYAATADQAFEAVRDRGFYLVLVNRIFDGDGYSGLELIRRMQADHQTQPTPVMLVSNYLDAQSQAIALGARPGFGKSSLGMPEMVERVGAVLHAPSASAGSQLTS